MARAVHVKLIQPAVTRANTEFSVTPPTDATEMFKIGKAARETGNPSLWNRVVAHVQANPYQSESDVAGAIHPGGSNPANDRQVLLLMLLIEHIQPDDILVLP